MAPSNELEDRLDELSLLLDCDVTCIRLSSETPDSFDDDDKLTGSLEEHIVALLTVPLPRHSIMLLSPPLGW